MPQPVPRLSLCFPIFNKGAYIDDVLHSFVDYVDLDQCEFVFFDNGSTDESSARIAHWQDRLGAVVHRSEHVLPINESWIAALRYGTADYRKLCLGDDACVADPGPVVQKMQANDWDFAVGLTKVISNDPKLGGSYYNRVHEFRQKIHADLTPEQKAEMLLSIDDSTFNPFGDINAWIFSASCLSVIPDCGKTYNGMMSFPDLELTLRSFLSKRGGFVDEILSSFTYNDDSPAVRIQTSANLRAHYALCKASICWEYLYDANLTESVPDEWIGPLRQSAWRSHLRTIMADCGDADMVAVLRDVLRENRHLENTSKRSLRRRIKDTLREWKR
ncbi:glycosyltransferase family 2 protein [Crateriforma conspicua]|uniref:glycosyltransferase family 2 protein n=1 Tax=Crateriforma conspicua TaxID=2527996 RepID=UPI00118860F9|nr:glycosyltransferase [Crateriforma conspicua]QDV61222.1 Glycosyl transferase family 2 [Crateriforma conspicua]